MEKIQEQFKKYYQKYDTTDNMITFKYYHSLRVMDLARSIAQYDNFNVDDMNIITISALLHDYARFEQWTLYNTYSDIKSLDHGDLAVFKLFDNNEIINYTINKKYYDEIYDAIKYHNKYLIPDNLSEHNKKICKVIRDADKLDIFYLLGVDEKLIDSDDSEISDDINSLFFENKTLSYSDVKTKNDKIILHLAMVYDLNFNYSFKHLYENDLINKIYEKIQNKDIFKKYVEHINNFIKERNEL